MRLAHATTDIAGLHTEFGPLIHALDALWLDIVGHELTIVHGLDGEHSRHSRHYQGCAIDVRTWVNPRDPSEGQIKHADRNALVAEVRKVLGKNFWLLDHFNSDGSPSHFHIAFKPEHTAWTKS